MTDLNLRLEPILQEQFNEWKQMREAVYEGLDDAFHETEMHQAFSSTDWFCFFLMSEGQIMGLAELSARNIVDGCLSSPVAYIEGLYLKEMYRGKGLGREAIALIKNWCKTQGFTELGLDTELDNLKAQAFFNAVGLQETYRVVQFRADI